MLFQAISRKLRIQTKNMVIAIMGFFITVSLPNRKPQGSDLYLLHSFQTQNFSETILDYKTGRNHGEGLLTVTLTKVIFSHDNFLVSFTVESCTKPVLPNLFLQ